MIWINSIMDGAGLFVKFAGPAFLILELVKMLITKRFRVADFLLWGAFLFYLCCVFALVFLPLPSVEEALHLTRQAELMPLHCLTDVAKKPVRGTLLIVFNVLMTVPFGMFLRYYFGMDAKRVLLYSLALTTLIEFGQFSGLFFLFKGSYRLFEIDDLILNTAGGMAGYFLACKAQRFLPSLDLFERGLFRNGLRVACGKRRVVV